MFKKILKRYRRIIIAVVAVLIVGGVIIGVVVNHNKKDDNKPSGVSVSAGDDDKDNQADFNGHEDKKTTQPKSEDSDVDSPFDTVIEQKGSIIGEWTTSNGDTFDCGQVNENQMSANVSLISTGDTWSGAVETDNKTYIKLTDGTTNSVINIEIVAMQDATELGLNNDQVYLTLKFPGNDEEMVFRRSNEDYLNEEIKKVLEQEGDGVSGEVDGDEQYVPDIPEDSDNNIEYIEDSTNATTDDTTENTDGADDVDNVEESPEE